MCLKDLPAKLKSSLRHVTDRCRIQLLGNLILNSIYLFFTGQGQEERSYEPEKSVLQGVKKKLLLYRDIDVFNIVTTIKIKSISNECLYLTFILAGN